MSILDKTDFIDNTRNLDSGYLGVIASKITINIDTS